MIEKNDFVAEFSAPSCAAQHHWNIVEGRVGKVVVTQLYRQITKELLSDSAELDRLLALGAEKASEIAEQTLADVYQKLGFIPRR